MAKKDVLARGARSATFFPDGGKKGDPIELHNLSTEGRDTSFDNVVIERNPKLKERKVRPVNYQILVKRVEIVQETQSGILLVPETGKRDRPAEGIVVAVSDLITQVKVGDIVLFGKYAGQEVRVGGTEDDLPLLMEEDEILGVVEDDTLDPGR
jgi:chaperonin GroES